MVDMDKSRYLAIFLMFIIHFKDIFKKKCALGNTKFYRSTRNGTFKIESFRPSYSCVFQNK